MRGRLRRGRRHAPFVHARIGDERRQLYTLTLGDLKMVVDGAKGARITEFSLRGTNVLVTRDRDTTTTAARTGRARSRAGARRAAVAGPRRPPSTAGLHGRIDAANSIQLTSAEQSIAGIAGSAVTVTKQFTPVPDSGAIDVTYTLTNVSPTVGISLAPWQVSRVATGGLTFFGRAAAP